MKLYFYAELKIQSNMSFVTYNGNIKTGSHKKCVHLIQV